MLQHKNEKGLTPYQVREEALKEWVKGRGYNSAPNGANTANGVERRIVVADPIASYIRVYCIRDMELQKPDDVVEYLYRPGNERHTAFDLAGHPRASIEQDFLDKLAIHFPFESILRYVALPGLLVVPSKRALSRQRVRNDPNTNINTDLRAIFDWLRLNGVRQIMKVTVVDHGESSHKDSAIIQSLKGFGVEYLTWKKVDISSDVIARSSSVVKEISLYWSGNKAILMGWASKDGFNNKNKFPKLKTIRLFVKGGYDDLEILKAQTNRFKRQMACWPKEIQDEDEYERRIPSQDPDHSFEDNSATTQNGETPLEDNITVIEVFDNEEFNAVRDFSTNESSPGENPWIGTLKGVTRLLQNLKVSDRPIQPPKIAIIDNGIDATWPSIHGKIVKGRSFSPYPNSKEFMYAYYVPRGQHGTLVADIICRICPKPQLYIARMEERSTADEGAIEWAVDCDVDIICMSWTVEGRKDDGQDIQRLRKAVERAANKDILMFGSASDQGPNTAEKTYPGGFDECFRIGAASDEGVRLHWVNALDGQFLFPGKRLPFHSPDRDSYFYETGSSFATACAAGLAGVLLYFDRLIREKGNLKNKDRMAQAFKGLTASRLDSYVDVRKNLHDRFDNILRERDLADKGVLRLDKKVEMAIEALLESIAPPTRQK
ncbi:peptidase S8/S53 domain-containing protein [Hypoxylon sp. NC1633]|nr:peptidase S8/S53 domain-containing protein [Hypoxylon sp. NC1633]